MDHSALPPKQREAADFLLANDRVVTFGELHAALGHKSPGGMEYPNDTALIEKGYAVRAVGPRGGAAIIHDKHARKRRVVRDAHTPGRLFGLTEFAE